MNIIGQTISIIHPHLEGKSEHKGWRPGRQRRCGAKAVSLTGRDAQMNSRRWLTPRWHSLYSDDDYLSLTAFFLEPRRVQETYQPDKLPACPLLAGAYKTKSRQTLVFDPGASKDRLRACPFLRTWRALL